MKQVSLFVGIEGKEGMFGIGNEYMVQAKGGNMRVELRQMATAFLFHGRQVLMMRKRTSRITEFWSGLGGHLEEEELNDPKKACFIEIYEESGIAEEAIVELKL